MAKKSQASNESEQVLHWISEIDQARKREEGYRKLGSDILKIYESDDSKEVPFNILFSNTETLLPALFSSQPRPIVQRRFKDDDPLGKMAADAGKRVLEHLLDTNREGYEFFAESMESAVLDTLLPGRGMIAVKYDATFATLAEPRPPDEEDEAKPHPPEEPAEYAQSESICTESLVWDRVYAGYAKKWNRVPWLAYESYLSKEEVAALLGDDVATKLTYSRESETDDDGTTPRGADDKLGSRRTVCVYQIWDKAGGKKIRYLSPSYKEAMLKEEDDPLGLTGFFNTPRPMTFVKKSSSLTPTAPYKTYRTQAQELNRIQKRINKTIEAMKCRGVYDGALGDTLGKIMESDDNALIPADTASSLATEKGFENAIWFMPLETLYAVLNQLYQARESCKQVIYEITGISDILRGSTRASETATAQNIKNQWGTLRLKRMQQEVARYARDLLRMMLELAATKLSEDTWAAMTNLPFVTTPQRQQLDMQAQMLMQMQGPIPPNHPIQAELAKPVWGDVLTLLRDDLQRSYRIDVETNSTVEPEATEDKKELAELLAMLGQFLNGVGPLVAKGVMPFEVAQSMMMFVARRHRLGTEIEDHLRQMKAPQQEDDGKGAEMAQQHMEMQKQHAMSDVQLKQKQAEMALQEKTMQADMQMKQREMDLHMREMALQMKESQFQMTQQVETKTLDMDKQRASEEIGVQRKLGDLENRKYKTENVVNQKADMALGQGIKAMQGLVEQLVQAVESQVGHNEEMLGKMIETLSKPRTKKAIRGKDGRLEGVEEVIA